MFTKIDERDPLRICNRSSGSISVRGFTFCSAVLVWAALAGGAAAAAPSETLVICPAAFQPSLAPWLFHRADQGHRITVVEPAATAQGVRRQIREAAAAARAAGGDLRFVVLVGDAPGPDPLREHLDAVSIIRGTEQDPPSRGPAWAVPTVFVPAQVNVLWGSEPEIATDSPLADLDDDGLPDVAIGRLPVRSPEELRTVVDKILRYETAAGHELWRRQVNIVAGLGGFGRIADAALESTTRTLLTHGIPAGYHTHLTYASWQSPYCPPPARFRDSTIDGFNAGCLFWVYLGHGRRTLLDNVYVPGGSFPIFAKTDVAYLRPAAGSPIALLVACHSGAFDGAEESLAEAMATAAEGPVAALAGSRVTLPYGNAVLCSELMRECFTSRRETLGEMLLHAKRSAAEERADDPFRGALDLLAKLLSPVASDLAAERREHTLLYNLLGDPLLRIVHADEVDLEVPATATVGDTLTIRGHSTLAGNCTLELVTERGRLPLSAQPREQYDPSAAAAAEYAETYRQANDRRYTSVSLPVEPGPFTAELTIPPTARGPCQVRAFITSPTQHALGAAKISVSPVKSYAAP